MLAENADYATGVRMLGSLKAFAYFLRSLPGAVAILNVVPGFAAWSVAWMAVALNAYNGLLAAAVRELNYPVDLSPVVKALVFIAPILGATILLGALYNLIFRPTIMMRTPYGVALLLIAIGALPYLAPFMDPLMAEAVLGEAYNAFVPWALAVLAMLAAVIYAPAVSIWIFATAGILIAGNGLTVFFTERLFASV